MAYTKKTWTTGEILTATGMNNIEDGIAANDTAITNWKMRRRFWT